LTAYFIGNVSTKNYQNPFMFVKGIASLKWDLTFLRHGVYNYAWNIYVRAENPTA